MFTGQKTDLMHWGAKQKNKYPNKNEEITCWRNSNVVCSLGVKKYLVESPNQMPT